MTRTFYWLFLCSMLVSIHGALAQQNLNLALRSNGATASASSVEGNSADLVAANANDGDYRTRWSSQFSDPQTLVIDLGGLQTVDRVRISWETAYGLDFTIQLSSDGLNYTTIQNVTGNSPTSRNGQLVNEYPNLNGGTGRYVRLVGTARSTQYGYSIYEFEVFSYSNTGANLALGKQATASNTQGNFAPSNAFDGDDNTRWSTLNATEQYLYVDLRGNATISRFYLNWENAYGVDYELQSSNDLATWNTFATVSNNRAFFNEYSTFTTGRYVRVHGINGGQNNGGFSIWELKLYGTITPLPVQLAGFTAQRQAGAVALNWTTASELHNKGFEVQRSTDGQDFTALTFVAGAGSSAQARSYQYVDAAAPTSLCYYRLKQVDHDGTSAYSPTVAVAARLATAPLAALSVYPNPATAHTTLSYEAPAAQAARWTLRNALGQAVGGGELQVAAGPNALPVPLAGLAAGSYVLTLDVPGQTQQRTRVQVQ